QHVMRIRHHHELLHPFVRFVNPVGVMDQLASTRIWCIEQDDLRGLAINFVSAPKTSCQCSLGEIEFWKDKRFDARSFGPASVLGGVILLVANSDGLALPFNAEFR